MILDKVKELGQVMTPSKIVSHMIDDVLNLSSLQLSSCLFLDNSCGDGSFIFALLDRGVPKEHIYACDIDEEISMPVKNILGDNFRLGSFFQQKDWIGKFDVVIGNPPYVRIHNITPQVKQEISNFSFCFGMYDLYYAFYEYGLKMLKPQGQLLYISPNSFIKNASGKKMRDYIETNKLLKYFENFETNQQFDGYSTYTCIIKLSSIGETIACPWSDIRQKQGLKYSSLQNGIATLADKIFISDDFSNIESVYVKPIIKASTGDNRWCIYPPKTEQELIDNAPLTYQYLLSNKEKLLSRSITGGTKWFEYGRSQGLKNMFQEKIVIASTTQPDKLVYWRVGPEVMVYSGLYATAEDLNLLEQQLQSKELLEYLQDNAKRIRGDYLQITSTLLKNF